jgi:hypothetical protein
MKNAQWGFGFKKSNIHFLKRIREDRMRRNRDNKRRLAEKKRQRVALAKPTNQQAHQPAQIVSPGVFKQPAVPVAKEAPVSSESLNHFETLTFLKSHTNEQQRPSENV